MARSNGVVPMPCGEDLQKLSELLRISAETILRISGTLDRDRDQLERLAVEVDVVAERLMKIGSRRDQPLPG